MEVKRMHFNSRRSSSEIQRPTLSINYLTFQGFNPDQLISRALWTTTRQTAQHHMLNADKETRKELILVDLFFYWNIFERGDTNERFLFLRDYLSDTKLFKKKSLKKKNQKHKL